MKNDIPESFKKAIERTPRHIQMKDLENRIADFAPDALEAADLLDALTCKLRKHYDDPTEALLYATAFKLSLERLDAGYMARAEEELEDIEAMVKRDEKRMP